MSEADYIVVLDTGSTDGTYEALQADPRVTAVQQEIINPWRFDVARNRSMELIPEDADILVCTDFDELFEPGWARVLHDNWDPSQYNRAHYQYYWQHNELGEPQDSFIYDKVHTRDFHWHYPIHEVLWPNNETVQPHFLELKDKIVLHHWQDKDKSRLSYEPLLKLACEEYPEDSHIHLLYAREKLLYHRYDEAIEEYQRVLLMPDIKSPNKRLVLLDAHYQIAQCFYGIGDYWEVLSYCQDFIYIDPTYRDPYFLMAEAYVSLKLNTLAESAVLAGLKYGVRHNTWVETANAWLGWSDHLLGIIYYNLEDYLLSLKHFQKALEHEPNDVSLLQQYNSALQVAYNHALQRQQTNLEKID